MAGTGFWWILLAAGLWGVLHSLLAALRWKRYLARQIGESACRRLYRLVYVVLAVLTLLPVLGLALFLPDRQIYSVRVPLAYLMIFVQAAAALGALACIQQTGMLDFLGLRQVLYGQQEDPHSLMTTGLYRYVRHPLYSFLYLFLWFTPYLSWNLLALNLAFSIYLWIGSIYEERKLIEQFGDPYLRYRRSTPRFLPGWKIR